MSDDAMEAIARGFGFKSVNEMADFDLDDLDPYAHMPGALRLANDVLLEAGSVALRVDAVIEESDDLIADLMRAISALASAQEIVAGASRRLLDHTEKVAFA